MLTVVRASTLDSAVITNARHGYNKPPRISRYILHRPRWVVPSRRAIRRSRDVSSVSHSSGTRYGHTKLGQWSSLSSGRNGLHSWVRLTPTSRHELTLCSDYQLALKYFLRAVEMQTEPSDPTGGKKRSREWWGIKLVRLWSHDYSPETPLLMIS